MWANDSLHKDFIPGQGHRKVINHWPQGVPWVTIQSKIKPDDAAEKLQNVTEGQNKSISHSRSCVTVILPWAHWRDMKQRCHKISAMHCLEWLIAFKKWQQ